MDGVRDTAIDNAKSEFVCRLCLSTDPKFSIFTENMKILSKIQLCCSLEIYENDGLPDQICPKCMDTINTVINFKNTCEEVDRILRGVSYDTGTVNIKKESDSDHEYDNTCVDSFLTLETLENDDEIKEENTKSKKNNAKTKLSTKRKPNVLKEKIKNKNGNIRTKVKKDKIEKKKENETPIDSVCPVCGKIFHYKKITSHIATHSTEKPFVCEICQKAFRIKAHLKYHLATHSDDKNFPCEVCGKLFKHKENLKRHAAYLHYKTCRVRCDICGKESSNKTALKSHMVVHSGVKKFECEICHQKFAYGNILKQHRMTHTGEKPFGCRFCDSKFNFSRTLVEHERLHTGETPYKCPICDRGYAQLSNMKSHFKHNHKDYDFNKEYKGLRRKKYSQTTGSSNMEKL